MSEERSIRAVVVDDEPAARDAILTLLADHPQVEVVGQATNGAEAVEAVRRLQPDLLFLDVQMPDLDGFGVLEALGPQAPRALVFVTAHDEHALRAFDVHALDYVVKPFGRPRFGAAVVRALESFRAYDALVTQRTLASMMRDLRARGDAPAELALPVDRGAAARSSAPRRIGVRIGGKTVLVEIDGVDWVEADGDYARIHAGKASYLISQRMHALERLLVDAGFVRVHRSVIVNAAMVRELHRDVDGGGALVLESGVRLRVARGRWEQLQEALRVEEF